MLKQLLAILVLALLCLPATLLAADSHPPPAAASFLEGARDGFVNLLTGDGSLVHALGTLATVVFVLGVAVLAFYARREERRAGRPIQFA